MQVLQHQQVTVPVVSAPTSPPSKYDPALLVKLNEVINTFAGQRHAFTLAGVVNLINNADTSEKMDHVQFVLSKNDNNFYYRMGKMEAIGENGIYLNINPDTKKVFIAEKKQINTVSVINMDQLKQVLETEDYQLTGKVNGSLETISLINENHYTCKEYTVTFDTLTKKLTNIFYRMAYVREPMNKAKEKLITIALTQCDTTGSLNKYKNKADIIDAQGKLLGKYERYQLIHL
ncbi:hypothetical protein Mucpa_0140 [Mucilaginibacter paludis DSM 18603]|uniref:Uncharacterized protein n=2 Tax=Mucilaginibacter TaxID=423349 RepID=H1YES3_9SPHI|nr:hypothetical protein Mucpa_0140 [Mucilaginibacter paludis DSM 18603]